MINRLKAGEKYNRLEVVEDCDTNTKHRKVLFRCDCGKEKSIDLYHVTKGNIKSCGCYCSEAVSKRRWTGHGEISGSYLNAIKKGAEKRGIPFTADNETLWKLFQSQEYKCKLSGLPIALGRGTRTVQTASLDRIDSKLGYVEGNLQWLHEDVNMMKNALDQNRFLELCQAISRRNDGLR
jgi:hypothetical protein